MNKFKSLIRYTSKYKFRYLIGITFLLLIDLIQLIPPKLIGYLTDLLSKGNATKAHLIKYISLIVLISFSMAIGRYIWRIYIFGSARLVEFDMRNKLFQHLQKLSQNFYNQHKTGDLMALATNDLNAVRMTLGQGIIMITDAIVLTITTLSIMLSINVKLTLISLIPLPFVALVATKFGKIIHNKFLKVQESFSKLTDIVQENFSGIRIIKSFVQEEKEYIKFTKENQHNYETNMELVKIWGMFFPLVEFIASLSFVFLTGVGGTYVIYGYISLGDFIAFNMYIGTLVWPMMAFGWVINIIQRGLASLERIENILHQKPDVFDNDVKDLKYLNGDISIKNLTFKYPDTESPALENINLTVKEGQTLGIIGKTGSGKSTLVNLLLRLYNVNDNTIFIGGIDINRIPLKILRESIGFVPQDSFLFSTTITENINLPLEQLDMAEIIESTKAADIYDNILNFKDGFDTIVGERGVTLSGGQKQRISIARTLIKNPKILIFDDCLSAVDAKTEVNILSNLKNIMKEKTSIIISHRISAVKDADLIVVLDDGKIVEMGLHSQLIEMNGIYKSIFDKQQIEEKIQSEEV
ncbi:multidrug ABC transporter ATPase [Fervidicella metallireducens AeB]|uniref:Multidrug ABC transporter ATPase n=1 Tax=Fervidicella metallireducens AeB TaxID=1403537 RepID=A0A017RU79_9CLOT|nr:ABC transporter ATP-binding protein [Fervidicella metallireducens]EYE88328.1 multidrug ABC transporter ATPase [Fervidicella metallireducens AeB]